MGAPFECDLCSFRNICGRDPVWEHKKDCFTLTCIRRANLDVFWARESTTVASNLARIRRDYLAVTELTSMVDVLPELGNPVVEDRVGMKIAVSTLIATTRGGHHASHVQWETARKTPTWYRNVWDAGRHYVRLAFTGTDRLKATASSCPTVGTWFARFSKGCRTRMGVIKVQNEPLTAGIIMALDKLASEEWSDTRDDVARELLENVMCFALFGYCNALRGEEIPLVSLTGLLRFWDETMADAEPFIMTCLKGRFKGEMIDRWHCLPIPDRTSSGIPSRKWISQKLYRVTVKEGRRKGWLFLRPGTNQRAKCRDYDEELRRLLTRVRSEMPGVIHEAALPELFSFWRSPRRGATLATTGRVGEDVINLYNRWRKVERSRGAPAGLSMQQTYLHVRDTLPQLKMYGAVL